MSWRVALASMLGGVLFAWLLLILMAFHQPRIYDAHIFIAAALVGALFALATRFAAGLSVAESTSTARAIGCGCGHALAAFLFFLVIGGVAGVLTRTSFAVNDPLQFLAIIFTFGGLGVFGGIQFARLRRAEGERQRAALERQQLELARDLQQRLLPPAQFESERFRVEARNVAAAYVAGDFYDFVPIANGQLLIVIADVAGKGVAAGLIVATVKAMIPLLAANAESPDAILRELNARIAPQLSRREFVAMALAIFDTRSGELAIANAGIPDPLLVRGGAVVPLVVEGPRYPIGVRPAIDYLSLNIALNAGDRVLFFTDGLAEANVDGEPLGYRRVADLALRARGDIDTLFIAVEAMTSGVREDDWTAVSLEVL